MEVNNPTQLEQLRQEIINSNLSQEQKQELLKLLEEKTKISVEKQPKSTSV